MDVCIEQQEEEEEEEEERESILKYSHLKHLSQK